VEEKVNLTPSEAEIQAWIVARVSHLTNLPAAEIDVRAPLTRFGLDSVAVIALAADLEKWLHFRFRENPLEAQSTIESFAHYLAEKVAKKKSD
jgi:acyl carrier protein